MNYIIYLFDRAFSFVHMFLKPALSLSNRIGRPTKIPNAINANESVVNLAIPHSDEAKAKIDNCMKCIFSKKRLSDNFFEIKLLIKN